MAVPTITSVSPTAGPSTGHNLVEIVGTNFNTAAVSTVFPTPAAVDPVAVTVGGLTPIRTWVASSTRIRVLMPRYRGNPRVNPFPPVSVTVQNLDGDGLPVAGEQATLADAYSYQAPGLGPPRIEPPMTAVLWELIDRLTAEVCPNVYVSTHVDFGEEGDETIAIAKIPSVTLRCDFPRDTEWSQWDNYYEDVDNGDNTIDRYEFLKTYQIIAEVYLAAEGAAEALYLEQNLKDFTTVNPLLAVLVDQSLYPGSTAEDEYAIELTQEPRLVRSGGPSSITVYSAEFRIRGITVTPDNPASKLYKMLTYTLLTGDTATEEPLSATL